MQLNLQVFNRRQETDIQLSRISPINNYQLQQRHYYAGLEVTKSYRTNLTMLLTTLTVATPYPTLHSTATEGSVYPSAIVNSDTACRVSKLNVTTTTYHTKRYLNYIIMTQNKFLKTTLNIQTLIHDSEINFPSSVPWFHQYFPFPNGKGKG